MNKEKYNRPQPMIAETDEEFALNIYSIICKEKVYLKTDELKKYLNKNSEQHNLSFLPEEDRNPAKYLLRKDFLNIINKFVKIDEEIHDVLFPLITDFIYFEGRLDFIEILKSDKNTKIRNIGTKLEEILENERIEVQTEANLEDAHIENILNEINKLSERQQEVLKLRYKYGMTTPEVAKEIRVGRAYPLMIEDRVFEILGNPPIKYKLSISKYNEYTEKLKDLLRKIDNKEEIIYLKDFKQNIPLDVLDLDPMTHNRLVKKYKSINCLLFNVEKYEDLLSVPLIGETSSMEIINKMKEIGFYDWSMHILCTKDLSINIKYFLKDKELEKESLKNILTYNEYLTLNRSVEFAKRTFVENPSKYFGKTLDIMRSKQGHLSIKIFPNKGVE